MRVKSIEVVLDHSKHNEEEEEKDEAEVHIDQADTPYYWVFFSQLARALMVWNATLLGWQE